MMSVEHRIQIAASAHTVFAIYQAVDRWHTWDPDTRQARLEGPFEAGSRGTLVPTKGRAVPMLVTQVVPGRSFTVESRIPLFRMVFEHVLTPVDAGVQVVHRVTFTGALTWVLGRMLVKQVNAGLPDTLQRLQALAEQRPAA